MTRTIFFFSLLWLSLLFSILLFIPFPFLRIPGLRKYKQDYVAFCTGKWAELTLFLSGSAVEVEGRENIPHKTPFVIISNHQGYMDIPVLMKVFPDPLSFITKKELLRVPIINLWILALECINIDRKKPLTSYRKISERLHKPGGNPILLFPEGTRSRGKEQKPWKKAGMDVIKGVDIQRVYVQVDGTYRIWEEKNRIHPARVKVSIVKKHEED